MSYSYDISALGKKIHQNRHRLGLTQASLAEKLHISFQAISGWENSTSVPDLENLCKLSEIFGVELGELLKSEKDMLPLMIGIDGGGTKTEFALFDTSGHVYKRVRLSGCNASLVGLEQTLNILTQGINACLDENPNVVAVFVGIAGPKLDIINQTLSERYPKMSIVVRSDGVNAFCSGVGDFALICGTGSIIITTDENGYRRIAGWGARMGDSGSAYNFGRAALRHALAYEDNLTSHSPLYDILLKKLNTERVRTAFSALDVPGIASLSVAVFEAFENGCEVSAKIIDDEMKELAWLLDSAFPHGGVAVMCGGVMEHRSNILFPILKKYLASEFELTLPTLPPIYGACVACCKEQKISIGDDFESNFSQSYHEIINKI